MADLRRASPDGEIRFKLLSVKKYDLLEELQMTQGVVERKSPSGSYKMRQPPLTTRRVSPSTGETPAHVSEAKEISISQGGSSQTRRLQSTRYSSSAHRPTFA
jgi:hypothetical protein